MIRFAVAFLALLSSAALAQPLDEGAERQRIQTERAAAEQRFVEAQKACRSKFAVNDCVAEARRVHSATVSELKRQERVLNDADRKRRAAERQKEIDERHSAAQEQADAQRREKALADQKERDARAAEKASQRLPDGSVAPQGTPRKPPAPKADGITPDEAARNRADYEQRVQDAQKHRQDVEERNAQRTKPPAADLPPPPRPGASAPGS